MCHVNNMSSILTQHMLQKCPQFSAGGQKVLSFLIININGGNVFIIERMFYIVSLKKTHSTIICHYFRDNCSV